MQIFLSKSRLKTSTIKIIKYQIFYVENSKFENKLNDSKMQFVFVKIVIFISNQNFENSNILSKKIKKTNKKNSMYNRICKCWKSNSKSRENNILNLQKYSKNKKIIYFEKNL